MPYPVAMKIESEPRFPEYELATNPFSAVGLFEGTAGDLLGNFWACVAAKETNRIWWEVVARAAEQEAIGMWLLRDAEAVGLANMQTIAGLMRRMAVDPDAHFLALYMPLTLAYDDPIKAIARTLSDRIIPTDLRKCFYVYAADRVEEVIGTPEAEELSSFDDLPELLDKLRNPRQSGIHRFLLPTRKQQVDEQHAVRKADLAETEEVDEEERKRRDEERDRIAKAWEQRKQLTGFLERRLHRGDWGEGMLRLIRKVFETSSFSAARDCLTDVVDHRGSLAGLLRFLRHRYSKIIIMVDQVEAFGAFTESEKAMFYGALGEFDAIAGPNAMWIFASFPDTMESIGKRKLAAFDMFPLELAISRAAQAAPIPTEVFADLVRQFLAADSLRQGVDKDGVEPDEALRPFDAAAIEKLLEVTEGDTLAAAVRLGELLETAHATGAKTIDAGFVTEQAEKWAEEAARARAEEEARAKAEEEAAAEAERAKAEQAKIADAEA